MPVIQGPSTGSGKAPEQHSQPSRKGKKAWRKNVDVTEVEKGLQDLNEEIIRGGVIKEKASSDLFTIDVKGGSTSVAKLRKRSNKVLKVDEILSQRSVIPSVSSRKRPGDKTTNGLVPAKRQRTDWVPHKELARLRRVANGRHEDAVTVRDANYDVWDAAAETKGEDATDFLPKPQMLRMPKSMKQQPISLTASGKPVPAVQNPTGGYSYNPAFADYEKRLTEESVKALEAEKKRLAAEAADRQKQEAVARSAAEAEAAEERANMSEWEEDSEWEGFQSGVEDEKPNTKQSKRKTQVQRNRIKRRKEEERLAKHKAAMKERRVQEQRILDIAQEVEEREQQRAAVAEESSASDEGDDDNLRRRQLGKFKLPEKDLELVLPDELQESLRLLKPEGNLLKDRYRTMLVRGRVESRRHIPFKKQAKTKLTEKWAYKDFVL
ncbi:nop53 (60S ribosomal biogenesis) domain-containing protein [Hirsutella rhossiliensis]|uniref:Ribosome biogenesis protein NOP53 n=1 Tax=Hirsutella rhossiliensis TaxID=111463 RepID=A0A9P8MQA6_9HYPO|nr:nop53 (60S ribosomal biogenesis) domain-containing protein [Hirsutella rhossiliensis]KAH0960313.1 nop53 (60S ribosomal biogenesis) domain-containing protein [Hirsutella rhossiliensis]